MKAWGEALDPSGKSGVSLFRCRRPYLSSTPQFYAMYPILDMLHKDVMTDYL